MISSQPSEPNEPEDSSRHPVEVLADEFAGRIRNGENPSIEEYEARHPEWASVIRQVFEPIAVVERISAKHHAEATKPSCTVPSQLGDFRIVREIGRGGMGIVYEAVQVSLQRRVALKVINSQTADQEKLRYRFRREAEAAAGLHHTNIVQVYGSGEDNGVHYYAMQLIHGAPLNEVVDWLRQPTAYKNRNDSSIVSDAGRKLLAISTFSRSDTNVESKHHSTIPVGVSDTTDLQTESDLDVAKEDASRASALQQFSSLAASLPQAYYKNAARIIADVANALGYAHRQQILHRDIKPANLILDREGTIWVTDFGLARRLDNEGATQAGEVLGTIRYMAPEQIAGGGDARMDIYSLGLCLFELVTLRPPFDAPKQRLLDPLRYSVLPSPQKLNPNLPRDLDTIIRKACAMDLDGRYPNAVEFEADLRRFIEDRPILARKSTSWEHLQRWAKRNPAVASLSAFSLVMLMTLVVMLGIWNHQQSASLAEINRLYREAETSLIERTQALDKERRANLRAEANLQLATQAFDTIIDNIASRGNHLFDYEELDDDSLDFSGTMLSQADVSLLDTLLVYFKQLGEQNEKDLSIETASAQKRVGDIQQKIGKLEEAESSYLKALEIYKSLTKKSDFRAIDERELLRQQISIYQELISVLSQQNKILLAWEAYLDGRRLIETDNEFLKSQEGRFQLAKLLNRIGRMSTQLPGRPMRGDRQPPPQNNRDMRGNQNRPRTMEFAGLPMAARLRKETELNREAIDLLNGLIAESPDKASYQAALAQAFRDESRIAMVRNEREDAERALLQAIELLNRLMERNPDSPTYRYQLAETLLASTTRPPTRGPGGGPGGGLNSPNESDALTSLDIERLDQALEISNKLLAEHPLEPTYLALKGAILSRKGQANAIIGRPDAIACLEESVRINRGLSERFPDLPLYRTQLVESLLRLSRIETNRTKAIGYLDQATAEASKFGSPQLRNQIGPILERIRERRQLTN
jgi:serine/threonine protein kinase